MRMKLGDSYVRSINLMGVDEVVSRHGFDIAPLLIELDIPAQAFKNFDMLVSFQSGLALIETAAQRFNIPNLGMELVLHHSPEFPNLGPLLIMARFVGGVEEWVDMALRYWQFHTNGFTMQLIKSDKDDSAVLRYIADPFTLESRHFTEACFANIVGLGRVAADREIENPTVVRFRHRKPVDTKLLADFFRCPLEFGQLHSEIVFDQHVLQYSISGSMRLFKPLMALYMNERIRRMDIFDRSVASQVALIIPSLLGTGNCSIETVSEAMNCNVKKLQRQLALENAVFSDIFETVRVAMAKQLLTNSLAPISNIAGLLDYSSIPPFSSAFKRWTGQSPLKYRKSAQSR
jgi:AraC-like DNA-binding protein